MSSPQRAVSLTTPELPRKAVLQAVGRTIDEWGSRNLRALPWRDTRDPWHILVAEVALQQTQVPRVAERYASLTSALSSPTATVELGKGGVIALWSGLGYNARAVRLHAAAEDIVERFSGVVPSSNDDLRSLPGIGPYTAAAIEAFAFERDVAVYDTNVARVMARAVLGAPTTATHGWQVVSAMVPAGSGWSFNQAIIDVGATLCTARNPQCDACPLRRRCAWKRSGALIDPALSTAGTSRPQGRFEGSARQARGRVVERLRQGSATFRQLHDVTGWGDEAKVRAIVVALIDEGLITRHAANYSLG